MRKFACAAIASAFIFTITAPLPAIAYTQADADACMSDAFRFCFGAIPDESRVALCLAKNKRQLSPACAIAVSRPHGASADREPATTARNTNF
jgi:hypothetical protein